MLNVLALEAAVTIGGLKIAPGAFVVLMEVMAPARSRSRYQLALGMIMLGGLLFAASWIATSAIDAIRGAGSNIHVAIIAASATISVSVLSVVLGKSYESRRTIQQELRAKKVPVYEGLLTLIFSQIFNAKTRCDDSDSSTHSAAETEASPDLVTQLRKLTREMMVWGDDLVLQRWVFMQRAMKNLSNDPSSNDTLKPSTIVMMKAHEDLLFAIRRDLGHKNVGIKAGDLLSLFINDLDDSTVALLRELPPER